MNEKIAPIKECPYCGSIDGFFTKQQAHGTCIMHHNFDGSECDNSDYYDYLECTGGTYAYCINCKKRLFKMSELRAVSELDTTFPQNKI